MPIIEEVTLNLSDVDWLSIQDIVKERDSTVNTEISRLLKEYLIELRK